MYTEVIDTHTAEPIGHFVWHMTRLLCGESATGGSAFCHLGGCKQLFSLQEFAGTVNGSATPRGRWDGGRSETAGSDGDGALGGEGLRCSPYQDISS